MTKNSLRETLDPKGVIKVWLCDYFFLERWANALAAAVLEVLLVRRSRKTAEAAEAALLEVVLLAILFAS